jgi:hypothetical protein
MKGRRRIGPAEQNLRRSFVNSSLAKTEERQDGEDDHDRADDPDDVVHDDVLLMTEPSWQRSR